jgi:methyl-accepting chemotaxis protein
MTVTRAEFDVLTNRVEDLETWAGPGQAAAHSCNLVAIRKDVSAIRSGVARLESKAEDLATGQAELHSRTVDIETKVTELATGQLELSSKIDDLSELVKKAVNPN